MHFEEKLAETSISECHPQITANPSILVEFYAFLLKIEKSSSKKIYGTKIEITLFLTIFIQF